METISSSETSVYFYETTRLHISEDITLNLDLSLSWTSSVTHRQIPGEHGELGCARFLSNTFHLLIHHHTALLAMWSALLTASSGALEIHSYFT
jgi:hypothetical protein